MMQFATLSLSVAFLVAAATPATNSLPAGKRWGTGCTANETVDVIISADIAAGLLHSRNPNDPPGKTYTEDEKYKLAADADDGFGLLHALRDPYLCVRAVSVQFGNGDGISKDPSIKNMIPDMMKVAQDLLQLEGWLDTVPVYQGSQMKFQKEGFPQEDVGLDQTIKELAQIVRNNSRPITLISIAPATDLAYLTRELLQNGGVEKVEKIIMEFGQDDDAFGFSICNKPVADLNAKMDRNAVEFFASRSGVGKADDMPPIVLVPFTTIIRATMNHYTLDVSRKFLGEAGNYMYKKTMAYWWRKWTNIFTCETDFHLWDTPPMLAAHPASVQQFDYEPKYMSIEDNPDCGAPQLRGRADAVEKACVMSFAVRLQDGATGRPVQVAGWKPQLSSQELSLVNNANLTDTDIATMMMSGLFGFAV